MINFSEYLEYRDGELFWKVDRKKIPAGELATWVDKEGYKVVTFPNYFEVTPKVLKAHRIIWQMLTGQELSQKDLIDHIDGNPGNNKLENLRIATHQQNFWNRKAVESKSGLKGAQATENGKFRARIRHPDGHRVSLGTYDTEKEAQAAYAGAAIVLFGEFARNK